MKIPHERTRDAIPVNVEALYNVADHVGDYHRTRADRLQMAHDLLFFRFIALSR
jgi:hypothetical protein